MKYVIVSKNQLLLLLLSTSIRNEFQFLRQNQIQMEDNDNTPSTASTATYKDYYKLLGVDYDATDEVIRLNYRKLALKWHPDKHKGDSAINSKFQDINEAYTVLSDPARRLEYDLSGNCEIEKYTLREYLARFKGMILTCNGLGINHTSIWTQHLMEGNDCADK